MQRRNRRAPKATRLTLPRSPATAALWGTLIALSALGPSARAHQPLFNPGSPTRAQAYPIPTPGVSAVITASGNAGTLGWYALTVPAQFPLNVTLFTSARCPQTYRPQLWLLGAGLPTPAVKPPFLPDGLGALTVPPTYRPYQGHGVTARKGPTLTRTLAAGTYYLVVNHGDSPGWAFLSLAGREVPGGTPEGRAALARFNRCG